MPSASTTSGKHSQQVTWLDTTFRLLAVLVAPTLAWAASLEVRDAIQAERILEIQNDIDKLSDVTKSVQANSLALVRLESKLDNLDEKIDEVKKLLRTRD
jgi:septal ring factor EnvC (AmiA/AmiB activator)